MARVPGRGGSVRNGRSKRVWVMIIGIAVFLVLMLPSEKYQLSSGAVAAAAQQAAQQATAAAAAAAADPARQQIETEDAAAVEGAAGVGAAAAASDAANATAAVAAQQSDEPAKQAAAAGVGTGVFYEVPGPKEGDPTTRQELLIEPLPDDCFTEEHADYDGPSLTWGLTFKLPSAAQCCQACKERKELQPDGKRCNIWVWCGSPTGLCWSRDIWNHTTGECWLKYQEGWDNNVDRAATNLVVADRGKYSPEFRQEHKTSPEEVQWTAGVIPAKAPPA